MTNLDKSPQEEQKELESTSKMDEDDPLYNEVVEFAVRTGKISASLIQRKYRLGYNRAARIIDLLEEIFWYVDFPSTSAYSFKLAESPETSLNLLESTLIPNSCS